MHGLARLALFFVSVIVASAGITATLRAVDRGQFENVSPEVRA
jgi:hypothetical protein